MSDLMALVAAQAIRKETATSPRPTPSSGGKQAGVGGSETLHVFGRDTGAGKSVAHGKLRSLSELGPNQPSPERSPAPFSPPRTRSSGYQRLRGGWNSTSICLFRARDPKPPSPLAHSTNPLCQTLPVQELQALFGSHPGSRGLHHPAVHLIGPGLQAWRSAGWGSNLAAP